MYVVKNMAQIYVYTVKYIKYKSPVLVKETRSILPLTNCCPYLQVLCVILIGQQLRLLSPVTQHPLAQVNGQSFFS